MKKTKIILSTLALFASLSIQAESDPVAMRINGKEILRSEFEYIYTKNSQQQIAQPQSVEEYMDLFINFKLKVDQAERKGYDTTSTFLTELRGYREQLAKPYLIDQHVQDSLVREVYDRMLEYVQVSHILLRLDKNASSQEREAVQARAAAIKSRIEAGEDFHQVAQKVSEDPSAKQNNGRLGYIQPFMTVLPFEDAAYSTPVGEISEPVLTDFGYHLVYVTGKQPNLGQIHVGHIMKLVPRNATKEQKESLKNQIFAIYEQIQKGADFEELAANESDDKASARQKGMLPWYGRGRMVPEFEEATFNLEQVGDYTKPFLSSFGWHIAKLYGKKPVAPIAEKEREIMRMLVRDERGDMGQTMLVDRLMKEYDFRYDVQTAAVIDNLLASHRAVDESFRETLKLQNLPLAHYANQVCTTKDLADHLENAQINPHLSLATQMGKQVEQLVTQKLLQFESTQLDRKYADFRNLMREYRDGILLFEVSNEKVWDRAIKDEEGLQKYFKKHKKEFKWDSPRYKGFVYACANKDIAKEVKKMIRKLPVDSVVTVVDRTFNLADKQVVQIQYGLFKEGENEAFDHLAFKSGMRKWAADLPVQDFRGKRQRKYPSHYTDVKGLVIADYQKYLEEEWIKEMRQEAIIEIHEDVIKTVKPL